MSKQSGHRLETTDTPRNVSGSAIEISGVQIASWSPGRAGQNIPPTQVHLVLSIEGLPTPLVLRMKSASAVDALIEALILHRTDVFGGDGQ